jgi:hypothetical protein
MTRIGQDSQNNERQTRMWDRKQKKGNKTGKPLKLAQDSHE